MDANTQKVDTLHLGFSIKLSMGIHEFVEEDCYTATSSFHDADDNMSIKSCHQLKI